MIAMLNTKCKQLSVLIFNCFYHLIIIYKCNLITLKKIRTNRMRGLHAKILLICFICLTVYDSTPMNRSKRQVKLFNFEI